MKNIKYRKFLLFVCLVLLTLILSFSSNLSMVNNFFKLKSSVSQATTFHNWSDLSLIDNTYSHSTIFYTKNTNIYAYKNSNSINVDIRDDVFNNANASKGTANTPIFTMNNTNQEIKYIITDCALDDNNELIDVVVSVTPVSLWKNDSNIQISLSPYIFNSDSDGHISSQNLIEAKKTNYTKKILDYNDPIQFDLIARYAEAQVTVSYYKDIQIGGNYTPDSNSIKYVNGLQSILNNSEIATNITKVNSFYYDIDMPVYYEDASVFKGREGIYPTSGYTNLYYKSDSKSMRVWDYTTYPPAVPKTRSSSELYLSKNQNGNGVFAAANPYTTSTGNINGIYYATSAELLTSDLSGVYTFNYAGVSCGMDFAFFSPQGYDMSNIDNPKKSVDYQYEMPNDGYAYTGESFDYYIKQYIPNNYYSNELGFSTVYNNFSTSEKLKNLVIEDSIDSGLTVLDGTTIYDNNNNDISNNFNISNQNNTVSASYKNSSGYFNTSSAYNNLYTLKIPVSYNTPVSSPITINNTASVSSTKDSDNATEVTKNTDNVSVTIKSPKVVYNCSANGGTGYQGNAAISTQYYNVDDDVDLTKKCNKNGWKFIGWSKEQLYNGNNLLDSYNIPSAEELHVNESLETTTLYAIYTKDITIKTPSYIKNYDGNSIYRNDNINTSCNLTSGYLDTGTSFTICNTTLNTENNNVVNVGTYNNELLNYKIMKDNDDVTSLYNVTIIKGNLTIKPIALTCTSNTLIKKYDGSPLTNGNGTCTGLISNHTAKLTNSGSITEVTVLPGDVNNDGSINSGDVAILSNHINNIQVITDENLLKNADINIDGSIDNNDLTLLQNYVSGESSEITEPYGMTDNHIDSVVVKNSNKQDVTNNYDISYNYGKLIIYQRELTINLSDQSKIYDGTPLNSTNECLIDQNTQLPNGQTISTCNTNGSITDVGSTEKTLNELIIKKNNNNISLLNYKIKVNNASLTIEPRPIDCTSASDSKVYDSTPLLNSNGTCNNLVDNHTPTFVNSGSITKVGTKENKITSVTIKDSNNIDVTNNYDINKISGTLTITKKPITVTTTNQEKVYDGSPLEADNNCSSDGLVTNHNISCTNTGSITNVGNENKIIDTVVIKDSNNTDVTNNYEITKTNGTLTITKKPITVTTTNQIKDYDGTPLNAENDCSSNELLNDQTLTCTNTGSITNVGNPVDKIINTVVIKDSNNVDITNNYDITKINKTLKINKRQIVVTTTNQEKVYDGTPLNAEQNTCSLKLGSSLGQNQILSGCEVTGSITNIGITQKEIQNITITDNNSNVISNDNYDITYNNGILKVTGKIKPSITKEITSNKPYYRFNDTIDYKITITNNESYDIKNVKVRENTINASFVENSNYEIVNDYLVNIPTISANSSVIVYAKYKVTKNDTNRVINEVQVIDAEADIDSTFDDDEDIKDTATANLQSKITICKKVNNLSLNNTFQFKIKGTNNEYESYITIKKEECSNVYVDPGKYSIEEIVPQEYEIDKVEGSITRDKEELNVIQGNNYNIRYTNIFTKKVFMHSFGRVVNLIKGDD